METQSTWSAQAGDQLSSSESRHLGLDIRLALWEPRNAFTRAEFSYLHQALWAAPSASVGLATE